MLKTSLESIRLPERSFWYGFTKRADERQEEQASRPLPTYNSKAGPRLDEATVETDRSKFETFKG